MIFFKHHQALLMRRESRAVLGHHATNLWLLVLVLVLALFSIAFAESSIRFLSKQMSNPFTNWVNIDRGSGDDNIAAFADSLMAEGRDSIYGYDNWQTEISSEVKLFTRNNKQRFFYTLYYKNLKSDLIHSILDKSNVAIAIHPDSIPDLSLGIILTEEALNDLGYTSKNAPPTIDVSITCNDHSADSLGFETMPVFEYGEILCYQVHVPIPLLAVVHRLPLNMSAIASYELYKYLHDNDESKAPFHLWAKGAGTRDHEYACQLHYFISENVKDFEDRVMSLAANDVRSVIVAEERLQEAQTCFQQGRVFNVSIQDENGPGSIERAIRVDSVIRAVFEEHQVKRVFKYENSGSEIPTNLESILSIHFIKLDNIRKFQQYVKTASNGLQVEMTQVEAKENFAAVSTMANILTVAIIVFSIIAIVLFIVNMMQSYFQKVKRNLGTFKAFGMSTKELARVYLTIIIGIVLLALVIAFALTFGMESLLSALDIKRSGDIPYLDIWNSRTLWAIIIILASTVLSVLFVMRRLLRNTPGDLIYDR